MTRSIWLAAIAAGLPLIAAAQPAAAPLRAPSAFADYRPWREIAPADWRAVNAGVAAPIAAASAASGAHAGHAGGRDMKGMHDGKGLHDMKAMHERMQGMPEDMKRMHEQLHGAQGMHGDHAAPPAKKDPR